jgi:hypothetical protein
MVQRSLPNIESTTLPASPSPSPSLVGHALEIRLSKIGPDRAEVLNEHAAD